MFSSGNPFLIETTFIECHKSVLAFIQEVALTADYTNPEIIVTFADIEEGGGNTWGNEGENDLKIMTREELDAMMERANAVLQSNDDPDDAAETVPEKAWLKGGS